MKEKINKIINLILPEMSLSNRDKIISLCSVVDLKGSSTFIQKNQRCKFEYFVLEGVVRSYLSNQEGDLMSISFFDENKIITPFVVRTQDNRSLLCFENITPCKLAKMSAEDFGKLISENEEIRRFANKVLRLELINKTKKEVQFISNDASQRLAQFRKDFNMLENRIPHNMIATYLGISPVTLSRLRKQLSLINKC